MKQIDDFLNQVYQERIFDIVRASFSSDDEQILNNGSKNLYVRLFDGRFIESVEKRQIEFTGGMKMHAVVLFDRYVVKVKKVF